MPKLMGASKWEQDLYAHLTSHEAAESDMLIEYRNAAVASPSSAFRYLSALILEDEIRHHKLFGDLASALKNNAELDPGAPAVPHIGNWGGDANSVLDLTNRLLENERKDANELRSLTTELKNIKNENLWPLLVKLMEMDTAKHIEILKFVKRQATKALK